MENNFTETELANEVWRDIDGYDGAYQVSDLGRVRSLKFGKVRVMKPDIGRFGYFRVQLWLDGNGKRFYVHRLVAQAFIPNDDESKTQINHRNEIKSDNRVSNLEWCTAQYNSTYNDIRHRCWINRNDYKRPKIEKLYDKNLSIKQNLELFKLNGVECSEIVIKHLRRDLNLERPQSIRDKVKNLYDKNLSYKQNLELFREKGIECSERTLWRLRRDLGLTNQQQCPKERV